MRELQAGKQYVALVAPGSIDAEQDALIFESKAHALRWVRAHMRAYGRPVYGPGYTYRRPDGTLDGDTITGACWPCFNETLRQGFGVYRVVAQGNRYQSNALDGMAPGSGITWRWPGYVSAAIEAGPKGGLVWTEG